MTVLFKILQRLSAAYGLKSKVLSVHGLVPAYLYNNLIRSSAPLLLPAYQIICSCLET